MDDLTDRKLSEQEIAIAAGIMKGIGENLSELDDEVGMLDIVKAIREKQDIFNHNVNGILAKLEPKKKTKKEDK